MTSYKCLLLFDRIHNYNEAHIDVYLSFLKAVTIPWTTEQLILKGLSLAQTQNTRPKEKPWANAFH